MSKNRGAYRLLFLLCSLTPTPLFFHCTFHCGGPLPCCFSPFVWQAQRPSNPALLCHVFLVWSLLRFVAVAPQGLPLMAFKCSCSFSQKWRNATLCQGLHGLRPCMLDFLPPHLQPYQAAARGLSEVFTHLLLSGTLPLKCRVRLGSNDLLQVLP